MFEANVTVTNKTGLHARPASRLVMLSQKYDSKITINHGSTQVDPKSIISVLSAGIGQGSEIQIIVEGPDEAECGPAIVELIESFEE